MNTENPQQTDFDICIVGGGFTGLSLLYGLKPYLEKGLINSVLLLEKEKSLQPIPGRSIALNKNTLNYFANLKVYDDISVLTFLQSLLEPIKNIIVQSDTNSQALVLESQKTLDNFGAVGDLVEMQNAVSQILPLFLKDIKKANPKADITVLKGVTVTEATLTSDFGGCRIITVNADGKEYKISSKLTIIANGANNIKGLNPSYQTYDHKQFGIIADVEFNNNINNLAIEYFTKHGPVAFLPTSKNTAAVVYCNNEKIEADLLVKELDKIISSIKKSTLNKALNSCNSTHKRVITNNYKYKLTPSLNSFAISKMSDTASFYLGAKKLEYFNEVNLCYLGNAAHTLHPVSGQGFNLAILGIQQFLKAFKKHKDKDFSAYTNVIINDYNQNLQPLVNEVYSRTNVLAKEFTSNSYSSFLVRDFLLYHLIAYLKLQNYIVNPSLGFINPKQFISLYKFLLK